jgi:uncharacterized integral membrane protein
MESNSEIRNIEIDQVTLKYLNTTRKWTMFLAIMGFILLGLFIIVGVIAGTFLSAFKSGETGFGVPESLMFIPFLLLAAIYFFPVLYLFRFSKHTAHAVQTMNKEDLKKAFRNLKAYFVYIGVLIIIVLTFYIVALVVTGTSMSFLKGMG